MAAGHRRRTGERIRALEEDNRRLRETLARYASFAAWEPMGDGLYAWAASVGEGHPGREAERALKEATPPPPPPHPPAPDQQPDTNSLSGQTPTARAGPPQPGA